MKDRGLKIKREIEELFFKALMVSTDDIDKFERKEMKKFRPIKNTWFDQLIKYIPKPIRESDGGFRCKIVSLSKTKTTKQILYSIGKKLPRWHAIPLGTSPDGPLKVLTSERSKGPFMGLLGDQHIKG